MEFGPLRRAIGTSSLRRVLDSNQCIVTDDGLANRSINHSGNSPIVLMDGLEPSTTSLSERDSNQLNYTNNCASWRIRTSDPLGVNEMLWTNWAKGAINRPSSVNTSGLEKQILNSDSASDDFIDALQVHLSSCWVLGCIRHLTDLFFVVRTGFEPVQSFIWFRVGHIPISFQNI